MRRLFFVFSALVLVLSACGTPAMGSSSRATSILSDKGSCGDGICSGPENTLNCTEDCEISATGGSVATFAPVTDHKSDALLYMTTMTHMEQGFTDDRNEAIFNLHLQQLTYAMDLADEYDAKLTVESEQPFARANVTWNLNFMKTIVERGHGVGTHCDFGFRSSKMSAEQYSQYFAENKALVDVLVGAENNLGCSGGGGVNDWARAASIAGFKYLDGIVGMHYLSMPMENRPGSEWTDNYIRSEGFHLSAPVDLYQRIYPFMVADATDFFPDEDGTLLISSGELGTLSMMAEGMRCNNCPLTVDDVDALVSLAREVSTNRDRTRVAKLTVYLPVNVFGAESEAVLRYFFVQMQDIQQQGIITWATQRQVYEAYMDWNN